MHGFRPSFRDWASEQTSVPYAVAEALANQVGSAVERSYARSDLFADWPCMLNEDTELRPRRASMRRKYDGKVGSLGTRQYRSGNGKHERDI